MPAIHYTRVVELHHPFHPGMPLWPGDPPVQVETLARIDPDGYALNRLSLGEHSGTHLNAPAHFLPGAETVDAIAAERLVLPAVVLDARAVCEGEADYALSVADVLAWEQRHGPIPRGCLAILFSGWQERWDDPARYLNLDANGLPHFPGFSLAAAQLLLAERGALGLGSDTHSIEPGSDAAFTVNRDALRRGVLVLENLCNLDVLPPRGATLAVGLLRVRGGSGAPAAVLAFVP